MQKILCINGSPRGRRSNTQVLVEAFFEGASREGASGETLFASELSVNDCMGCFACWNVTPGICVHKDDMPGVLEKMREADLILWATPLYHYGMTARLKRILERTLPLVKPWMVKDGEHFGHPFRYEGNPWKMVVVSNCGFPEPHHFHALKVHFLQLLEGHEENLLGTIFCTAGEMLRVPACRPLVEPYLEKVRNAGAEVMRLGCITEETASFLARPFVDVETFVLEANKSWNVPGEQPPEEWEALGKSR